jgi:hypothetical protein
MTTLTASDPKQRESLQVIEQALRRTATYRLPDFLNREMMELGERKESLTPEQRTRLAALVDYTEDRTLEKLHAEVALRRLQELVAGVSEI